MLMLKPCKNRNALLILAPRKDCAILSKVHMFLGRWRMDPAKTHDSLGLLAMIPSKLGALCLQCACSKSVCVFFQCFCGTGTRH